MAKIHHLHAEPVILSTRRRRIGALDIREIDMPWSDNPIVEAENMFALDRDGILGTLIADVRAAGYPEGVSTRNRHEFAKIAAAYVGVDPDPNDLQNGEAARAFVIMSFAYFEAGAAEAELAGDKARLRNRLLKLGLLAEWWRWRSAGHDAEAVFARPFLKQRPTTAATDAHKAKAETRHAKVLEVLRDILKGDPAGEFRHRSPAKAGQIHVDKLAKRYLDEASKIEQLGFESVRRIIKKAVLDKLLK